MGLRKKLHSFLGNGFKTTKFRSNINLALARLSVLKNQRRARFSVARSDMVELLKLGNRERALLRVEQVIKEQDMLDVFAMIEDYCNLLLKRVNLIEQEKACPDELKEAVASLVYAATRCGELPELQETRVIFTSQFGKEFAASAVELRNGCIVNPKIVQKLSTRVPSLENKMKVLKEICLEYKLELPIEKAAPVTAVENPKSGQENRQNQYPMTPSRISNLRENRSMLPEYVESIENFSDSVKMRRYTDIAEAAKAAFESAFYAAAAARAAVELSRSESNRPDEPISPNVRAETEPVNSNLLSMEKKVVVEFLDTKFELKLKKIPTIHNYNSDSSNDSRTEQNKNVTEYDRSLSASSCDSVENKTKEPKMSFGEEGVRRAGVFDESHGETPQISRESMSDAHFMNTGIEDDIQGRGYTKPYYSSQENFPRSPTGLNIESWPENSPKHLAEEISPQGAVHLNINNRPISVRTRRAWG